MLLPHKWTSCENDLDIQKAERKKRKEKKEMGQTKGTTQYPSPSEAGKQIVYLLAIRPPLLCCVSIMDHDMTRGGAVEETYAISHTGTIHPRRR